MNAYLISICLFPFLLLGLSFINKNLNNLKNILNNKLLKFISIVYILISSFILVISYLKITNNFYYYLTPPLLILILILLLCLFISNFGLTNIFKFTFIISILSLILMIFTFVPFKIDNSLNFKINSKINDYYLLFNYLFAYFDVIFVSLFQPSIKLSKKNYLITILSCIIINTVLIYQNYILFDKKFFLSNKFPYISKYLAISFNNIFEHIDLVYLIFITLYIIIRLSINTELFRLLCCFKRKTYKTSIFMFILIFFSIISNLFNINLNVINYIMFVSSLCICLFFILYKMKYRRIKNGKN